MNGSAVLLSNNKSPGITLGSMHIAGAQLTEPVPGKPEDLTETPLTLSCDTSRASAAVFGASSFSSSPSDVTLITPPTWAQHGNGPRSSRVPDFNCAAGPAIGQYFAGGANRVIHFNGDRVQIDACLHSKEYK